jgi:hypothetical protein
MDNPARNERRVLLEAPINRQNKSWRTNRHKHFNCDSTSHSTAPVGAHQTFDQEMKITHLTISLITLACSSAQGAVIVNGDFDTGSLAPWYVDRSFGSTRPWSVGSLDPHSGGYYAFNLGPLELRQNFPPILGADITQFSFFVGAQFPNRGNPMVELFYSDGSSSGPKEIPLDPSHASGGSSSGWIWDEVDLLPFVDGIRSVSGVSVVGVPNNVLRIDTFSLTAVPEPSIFALLGGSLIGLAIHRRRVEQDAPSNGGQRPSLNSGFNPRRG